MGEVEVLTALLLVAVFAPVVSGLATLALPTKMLTSRVFMALAGPAASVVCLGQVLSRFGTTHDPVGIPFIPSIHCNIDLIGDPLSLFFGLLVSGIGCLIVLYARGYFGKGRGVFAAVLSDAGVLCDGDDGDRVIRFDDGVIPILGINKCEFFFC